MSTLTFEQALQMAIAHHQAGQLPQAEALYRQILAVQPSNPDALHLLGVIASQVGQPDAAVELISQAIAINPQEAAYHCNLGEAYRSLQRIEDAIACYQRALALQPNSPETHNNLGIALYGKGHWEEAIASYERAIALRPDYAEAHNNLGIALSDSGQWKSAIASCRRALEINPDFAEAHNNLGTVLSDSGQEKEAILCYQRAVALRPDYAEAYNNLGAALHDTGRFDEAIACYQRALLLLPASPDTHRNLSIALTAKGELDEAIAASRQALTLQPDNPNTHNSFATALFQAGHIASAIASYRQAVRLIPDYALVHSNLVYTLHFDPTITPQELYAEHQEWNRKFAASVRATLRPHPNDPNPNRRLKIGYVSPDFCAHVCGLFLLPLFAAHDHTQVEVYCYASVRRPDNFTQRLKQGADVWRDTLALSDDQLAEQIREDGIDILVDLTMHMTNNRLTVFARKPAPVQVTYLAYCSTSGLETMDYRLTDPYLDPPGGDDSVYSETSIRLPQTYWCYPSRDEAPEVTPLPALSAGFVTFGCLNNFNKINPAVLTLWARLLRAVPNSRLVLFAPQGSHRERTQAQMAAEGIHPERLCFLDRMPLAQYFVNHGQTDIALDPFPYGGGTTTCDALWMGVPFVTLSGKTAVGRGGVSLLSNIGLPELIARTEDEYVKIVVELANDLPRLLELRATMRERMLASPLMDGPRFARGMEAAYRQMWTNWCKGQGRPLT